MNSEKRYDLVVVGGGPSGCAAAIAAGREGLSVLIIEKNGFLGGMAVAGLVNPFMAYWERVDGDAKDRSRRANAGIFAQVLDRLGELGGLHQNAVTFHEEYLKLVLDRMVSASGAEVLFHTRLCGAQTDGGSRIRSIRIANAEGLGSVEGDFFVDGTGNGDLAAYAGCEYTVGREEDGACQPMTLCFRLAGVDWSRWDPLAASARWNELQRSGAIRNKREDILTFPHLIGDFVHFNSTRVLGRSALDPRELSRAEMEGREQVFELLSFLRKEVPGFEKSELVMTAPEIGVRESRHVLGDYVLSPDDILGAVKFPDAICRGTYPIDIHNPSGSGTVLRHIHEKDYYTIPYRCMTPLGMDNLLVAGRPISAVHAAHSAFRIMPIAMNIGEAAGIAAAEAVRGAEKTRSVDVDAVRRRLVECGGLC